MCGSCTLAADLIGHLLLCLRSTWAAEPGAPAERRNWFETPFDQAVAGAPALSATRGPADHRGRRCASRRTDGSNVARPAGSRRSVRTATSIDAIRRSSNACLQSIRADADVRDVQRVGHHGAPLRDAAGMRRHRRTTKSKLLARVRAVEGVEQVFDQLIVGTAERPRWTVDPSWAPRAEKRADAASRVGREGRAHGRQTRTRQGDTRCSGVEAFLALFDPVQPL